MEWGLARGHGDPSWRTLSLCSVALGAGPRESWPPSMGQPPQAQATEGAGDNQVRNNADQHRVSPRPLDGLR